MTVFEPPKNRPLPWLGWPLLAFTLLFLALALRSAFGLAAESWPLTPWESAITTDAWRLNHHLPVYENPATGHATHMYGPLVTVLAAIGERVFGVDGRVPRAFSLAASLLTAVAAGALLGADRSRRIRLLIGAVAYLQFYRILEWSTDARPDAESILIGLLALAALYRGHTAATATKGVVWTAIGSAGLVVAFLFKQPAIVLCVVPLLVTLARRFDRAQATSAYAWAIALIPILVAGVAWALLRVAFPWIYFYMFTVPASYTVPIATLQKAPFECIALNVFFIFAVGMSLGNGADDANDPQSQAIDRWLLATIGVTLCFGMVARSKVGGGHNSLLPALIAMSASAVRMLDRVWSVPTRRSWPRLLTVALLPPLLFWSDLIVVSRVLLPGKSPMLVQHGDANYSAVIRAAATLPGKVVSIDDPTIALLAKGYAGRCGDCELDADGRRLPQFVIDGLSDADWLIQTKSSRRSTIGDDVLQRIGFQPATWKLPANASYALWHRASK